MNQFILKRSAVLLLLCVIIFFVGNNFLHLTDPDEVFYSLTAKEMAAHNDWLTPYIFNQPQFEKPILTYWLLKVAFLLFGETPFAARFFPAMFATLGVFAVYALGLLGFNNERRAFLAALILGTSAFYIGMGKTVFTDMFFTVLILYSLLSFFLAYSHPKYKRQGILGFYIFGALATLAKGPLGLLIPELTVVLFLLYKRELLFLRTPWFIVGFFLSLLTAVPWYWYMIAKHGYAFIYEFFYNDHIRRILEAEHVSNDRWFFYPLTMIAGLFPWSLFLMAAFVDLYKKIKFSLKPFEYFLLSWIVVVLIIFQFAHSKLASYILPMFPALALLAANFIDRKFEERDHGVIRKLSYILIGILVVLSVGSIVGFNLYKNYVPTLIPAYFLSASLLSISGISLTLLLKDKVYQAIQLLSLCLVPIFITAYIITGDIEPHVSMYEATTYIPSKSVNKTTILTSKAYARGVRYFTDQEVAVIDINGRNYFSPHPIPILNTREKVLDFLKSQPETFAVVRKSAYEDLNSFCTEQCSIQVLKKTGRNYVLKIKHK